MAHNIQVFTRIAVILMMLFFVSLHGDSYRRPTKVTTRCCKSVSKARIPYTITGFNRQNALKPCVDAIIFFTKETGPICSDPKATWINKRIKQLNETTLNSNEDKY
ncbi:C-C motif chemokine 20-like [Protopterus annectens]|uniref:C-C motif chemokine 20-like n=1 Tax=Protopterus annectens TaxID=7888 RepID=UPI001CF985D7|nr:C-C motif chemokine 20-like [Protopterus annectens]